MSEENKKVEQSEQVAEASELSEQDLDSVAGGTATATTAKPPTTIGPIDMPGKSW
jgi:hypothetical protein